MFFSFYVRREIMKKLLVVFVLLVAMVACTFAVPVATAETKANQNGTSYSTYTPPNMQGAVDYGANTGDMDWVPYNNDVLVPLSGGVFGRTLIADYNGDGYLDIKMTGNGLGDKGTWIFYGNPDAQNPESPNYMVLGERRKTSTYFWTEYTSTCVYDDNGNYIGYNEVGHPIINYNLVNGGKTSINFLNAQANLYNPTYINGDKVIYGRTTENNADKLSSGSTYYVHDVNGDGIDDLVYALSEWGSGATGDLTEHGTFKIPDYGYIDRLWGDENKDGVVNELDPDTDTNGDGKVDINDAPGGDGDDDPPHGHILYCINSGTNTSPVYAQPVPLEVYDYEVDANGNKTIVDGTNLALDSYGNPSPIFHDFDNDGDLDIVISSFVGILRYVENIGTAQNPIYIQPQRLEDKKGNDIYANAEQVDIRNCDWNNDGFMDFIVGVNGDEGNVYLCENTGKFDENNMPIFTQPKNFFAPSDKLKISGCSRPFSADWDNDGDEDLIVSDSGGFFYFVKNVTIEKALAINPTQSVSSIDLSNPSWEGPIKLRTPDDKIIVYKGGYAGNPLEGSENFGGPQGPTELNYGYVNHSVADWDMDGILDIIYVDIYGRVRYLKGIEGDLTHVNYPEPINVEWVTGQKRPAWYNWWDIEEGALSTFWRVTPEVVDLPLDEDGDGVAEGDGLMDLFMIDHEGYFAFYQRYRDRDGSLKLKEGRRIFKLNGNIWQPTSLTPDHGKYPHRIVDWDGDGDLDVLTQGGHQTGNVFFYENISTVAGEYNFVNRGDVVANKPVKYHEVCMATCDWNKDGKPDILAIGECGNLYYFINPQSRT